jgi:hypothetical protein
MTLRAGGPWPPVSQLNRSPMSANPIHDATAANCPTCGSDSGQATAEYALVLLGAAAVALLLIGWATTTDQVSRLFDFVVDQIIGRSG